MIQDTGGAEQKYLGIIAMFKSDDINGCMLAHDIHTITPDSLYPFLPPFPSLTTMACLILIQW